MAQAMPLLCFQEAERNAPERKTVPSFFPPLYYAINIC